MTLFDPGPGSEPDEPLSADRRRTARNDALIAIHVDRRDLPLIAGALYAGAAGYEAAELARVGLVGVLHLGKAAILCRALANELAGIEKHHRDRANAHYRDRTKAERARARAAQRDT